MSAGLDCAGIRALLLDIEGTTTPVAFVHAVLFPYARAHVRDFLDSHRDEAAVLRDLARLREDRDTEARSSQAPPPWRDDTPAAETNSAVACVRWLMDRDRKSTGLKSLQGRIWEAGYRSGELHGEVYPDVPQALDRWRRQGRDVAIFSSGSVLAQKLLFGTTPYGDLTRFIRAYFDTTTGAKQEAKSYDRISAALGLAAAQMLFVSDIAAELDAAQSAGVATLLCARGGAGSGGAGGVGAGGAGAEAEMSHAVVGSFEEVCP